jgi:hypothetical protein
MTENAGEVWIGYSNDEKGLNFEMDPMIFAKHIGIFGSTGSGKTVLGKILIEEMALQKVPCIVIDPQGDIASMILRNDEEVLSEKGMDLERVEEFFNTTNIQVFTPSSNKGMPISLNPIIFPPFEMDEMEAVRILDNVSSTLVQLLLKLVKYPPTKEVQSKSVIYTILLDKWKKHLDVENLQHLTRLISEDRELYPKFINKTDKDKLVVSLNNLLIGSTGLLFSGESKLEMSNLLASQDGRVPVNIFFLKSLLNENEKFLFIAILIQALYAWMIQQGSTDNIKCFFYMDEVAPFIPAGMSNPPGKEILLLLLRQARKYGLACGIATQSPKDIDYHGLDQLNTLFVGRIISQQSQKVIKNLLSAKLNPDSVEAMLNVISTLTSGNFVGFIPDAKDGDPIRQFKTRYLFSKHVTLTEEDLKKYIHPSQSPEEEEVELGKADTEPSVQPAGPFQFPAGESEEQLPAIQAEEMDRQVNNSPPIDVDCFLFQPLPRKIVEDIIKRTIEFEYFEKLPGNLKIQKFVEVPVFKKIIFEYIQKFLQNFAYSPILEEKAENGLPVMLCQGEPSLIAVAVLATSERVTVGIFSTLVTEVIRPKIEKLVNGLAELVKKVK